MAWLFLRTCRAGERYVRVRATLALQPDCGVFLAHSRLVLRGSWTVGGVKYSFLVQLHPLSAATILFSQPSS